MNNHARAVLPAQPVTVMPRDSNPGAQQNGNVTLNPDFTLVRNGYCVRLANEGSALHGQASQLVSNMYGSRGLQMAKASISDIQSGQRRREQVTLAAFRDQHVLGTLTLGVDSGSGLLAESLYRREIDTLRTHGGRLCEVTRLALHPKFSCREVMATLFHVAFVLASEVHKRTDLLAEVHPRHAGFYRRTMGYRVVGPEQICPRVGAPAVLMHLCLDLARSQIIQFAGTCTRADRNLYRLFLPADEQDVLRKKLITF